MKRFLVERTFPRGLFVPIGREGRTTCDSIVAVNSALAVTWIHSYVSTDRRKAFCVYEAATAQAVRRACERNGFPVERITEIEMPHPPGPPGSGDPA